MNSATPCRTALGILLVALLALPPAVRAGAGDATAPVGGRSAKSLRTPDALARHLCDVLQTLPQERKGNCCGTSPTGGLAGECVRMLSASLRAKALTIDPADVDRCAAESSRQLEGCDWVTPLMPRTPETCRAILHGRLDVGARCRSSLECKDSLFCWGNGPGTPGVCAPPGVPGALCAGAPDLLATYARQADSDGAHRECAGFCLNGRCAAFVPTGGACPAGKQCAPGNHCVSGHCVAGARPQLGEPCEGTTCDDDLVCVENRCSRPKKSGDACTKPFECEAACVFSPGATAGTCGMKCSNWPPAGYTPPLQSSPRPAAGKSKPRG